MLKKKRRSNVNNAKNKVAEKKNPDEIHANL